MVNICLQCWRPCVIKSLWLKLLFYLPLVCFYPFNTILKHSWVHLFQLWVFSHKFSLLLTYFEFWICKTLTCFQACSYEKRYSQKRAVLFFLSSPFTHTLSVIISLFSGLPFLHFFFKKQIYACFLYTHVYFFLCSLLKIFFCFYNISLGGKVIFFRDNNISYMECGSNNTEEYTKRRMNPQRTNTALSCWG